jgi:hypothetical protein
VRWQQKPSPNVRRRLGSDNSLNFVNAKAALYQIAFELKFVSIADVFADLAGDRTDQGSGDEQQWKKYKDIAPICHRPSRHYVKP